MSEHASSVKPSSGPTPSVVRVRLDPSSVDPRLSFFASPGDAVCEAYEAVARRLMDNGTGTAVFMVVASRASRAQSVVAANLGSALSLDADVVLLDARTEGARLPEIFGLGSQDTPPEGVCLLVSERLGLVSVGERFSRQADDVLDSEVLGLRALGDVLLILTDRSGADVVKKKTGLESAGVVVLVEQDELAAGVLEAFVREIGADDILGCLVVENGRLSS